MIDLLAWVLGYLLLGVGSAVVVCLLASHGEEDLDNPKDMSDWFIPLSVLTIIAWPVFLPLALLWWVAAGIMPILLKAVRR